MSPSDGSVVVADDMKIVADGGCWFDKSEAERADQDGECKNKGERGRTAGEGAMVV